MHGSRLQSKRANARLKSRFKKIDAKNPQSAFQGCGMSDKGLTSLDPLPDTDILQPIRDFILKQSDMKGYA